MEVHPSIYYYFMNITYHTKITGLISELFEKIISVRKLHKDERNLMKSQFPHISEEYLRISEVYPFSFHLSFLRYLRISEVFPFHLSSQFPQISEDIGGVPIHLSSPFPQISEEYLRISQTYPFIFHLSFLRYRRCTHSSFISVSLDI